MDKLQAWYPARTQKKRKTQDTQPRAGHMVRCPGTKEGTLRGHCCELKGGAVSR